MVLKKRIGALFIIRKLYGSKKIRTGALFIIRKLYGSENKDRGSIYNMGCFWC